MTIHNDNNLKMEITQNAFEQYLNSQSVILDYEYKLFHK